MHPGSRRLHRLRLLAGDRGPGEDGTMPAAGMIDLDVNGERGSVETKRTDVQYMTYDGAFVRCSETCRALPPGLYGVVDMGRQGWGLKPKPVVSDELIDIPGTVVDDVYVDIDGFMGKARTFEACRLTHKRG